MMSEWISASTSPSASMSSTDLSCGSRVILRPGGGVKSTSSSSSATHSTDLCGTPYSCSRMPRIQWIAVTRKDLMPIFLPIRSFGFLMPLLVLMNTKPWRKRRCRNTGIAVIAMPLSRATM